MIPQNMSHNLESRTSQRVWSLAWMLAYAMTTPVMADEPSADDQTTGQAAAPSQTISLLLGEPVTVTLAPPEVRGWGPYQFPGLSRLPDGRIQVSFHVEADSATAYGLPPARAVSADEGRTWTLLPREQATDAAAGSTDGAVRLPNGDRLQAKPLRSLPVAGLTLPTAPVAQYTSYGQRRAVYRVEDLPEACAAGWILRRLPAGATQWVEERVTVRLPGEVRTVCVPEGVMPLPWLFPQFVVAPDDSLLAVNYTLRRITDGRFQEKCPVTILRSTDAGRRHARRVRPPWPVCPSHRRSGRPALG